MSELQTHASERTGAPRIVIIGAGAAGLMAAIEAASAGARVVVLEKMDRPGRKLLITGKGRCNLTNVEPMAGFLRHFGDAAPFLKPAFHGLFADGLTRFFEQAGVATVTERGGRVFPASERAADIVDALVKAAEAAGAVIRTRCAARKLIIDEGAVRGVETGAGVLHPAEAVIVAAGGASYPATGSTGDGYRLAGAAGHRIIAPRPALVPLVTAGGVAAQLQGLSLKNVTASLWAGGRKQASEFGEMLFTHYGLSGPIILTLSKRAVEALERAADVVISIDLKPALDERLLDARLLRDLSEHGKRQFHTILKGLLPASLIPVCIEQTGVAGEKTGVQIRADERRRLRLWLKDFRFDVTGHRGFAEAIVTAGGVDRAEVDPKTMESRRVRGLYFAGEVLDIDADTGGYNLQAAFSTGWLAGRSAASQGPARTDTETRGHARG